MQRDLNANQKLQTVLVDINLCDKMKASEYHDLMVNPKLELRFADGELERLGIVNVDPFDLNGQSKLYARFIDKSLNDQQLASFFSEFGEIQELFSFKDEKNSFNGTCFIKYAERRQAISAISVLNNKY